MDYVFTFTNLHAYVYNKQFKGMILNILQCDDPKDPTLTPLTIPPCTVIVYMWGRLYKGLWCTNIHPLP